MSDISFEIDQMAPLQSDEERYLPGKLLHAGDADTFFVPAERYQANRQMPFSVGMTEITIEGDGDNSAMFKTPTISESLRSKLNVSSEIEELRSENNHFKHVLDSIFNLIENPLNRIGYGYHIDVALDVDQDLPSWSRANIIVGINGIDYQQILNLWDDIGSEIGCYLESLKRNSMFPQEEALRLYNFINISFVPEGSICQ